MRKTGGISLILGVGLLAASATIATAQQPSVTKITQTGQSMTSTSSRVVHVVVVSVNGNKVVAKTRPARRRSTRSRTVSSSSWTERTSASLI